MTRGSREDPEPIPVSVLGSYSGTKENGDGNGNPGGDDPLWDAWDDPLTKKAATKLEKLSTKHRHSAPQTATGTHTCQPNHFPAPAPSLSLSSSWSSSGT